MSIGKPLHITLTGADRLEDLPAMQRLAERYPIEWALLLSPKRCGSPRYPDRQTLEAFLACPGLRLALHICGDYSRAIMAGEGVNLPVDDLRQVERIQINHAAPNIDMMASIQDWLGIPLIAQCRGDAFPSDSRVQWLYDRSGGTGVTPDSWPAHPESLKDGLPAERQMVGYAGGITPANIADILPKIQTGFPYWIDLESGLRTDDRFDLIKCTAICAAIFG